MCESWRPGVADRLGLGYETVLAVNPSVIYCSLTGFGQDGPLRDVPGHDVNFQAIAGALAPRGPDQAPEVSRLPVADLEGGTVSAVLICAAWAHRMATGLGERIDVAMADVVAWWVGNAQRHGEHRSRQPDGRIAGLRRVPHRGQPVDRARSAGRAATLGDDLSRPRAR